VSHTSSCPARSSRLYRSAAHADVAAHRYLRLNDKQAAEIQRAIAAADDADAATSVARAQMEKLRLQMEAQGAELAESRQQLQQQTHQLQAQLQDSVVRFQELQSQRDALAKALRQSRCEADAASREAQESNSRRLALEAALVSMGEQVAEYECVKQAVAVQQQALLQQQQDLSRRERIADESCKNFAAARAESQSAVTSLKMELSACNSQLQRVQGQLELLGGSQGAVQRLEEMQRRLKHRRKAILKVVTVSHVACCNFDVVSFVPQCYAIIYRCFESLL
jgi:chromosome segregation ATPase